MLLGPLTRLLRSNDSIMESCRQVIANTRFRFAGRRHHGYPKPRSPATRPPSAELGLFESERATEEPDPTACGLGSLLGRQPQDLHLGAHFGAQLCSTHQYTVTLDTTTLQIESGFRGNRPATKTPPYLIFIYVPNGRDSPYLAC